MKILFLSLTTFDQVGGIQTFNRYFIDSLEENGFSWQVISLHDSPSTKQENIYCCSSSLLKFVSYLIRFADQNTVVVWGHISLGALLPYLKRLLSSQGNILVVHGTEAWSASLHSRKKRAFNHMNEIWTVSSYTRDLLVSTHGLDESKFRIFPNCITVSGVTGSSDPYPSGHFDIMTLLRLDRSRKLTAVYNIVDALPALLKKEIPAHFTVVGKGNDEEEVRRYVDQKGMKQHVTFTGFQEDTRPYLEHCDVFSLISDGEGFGIVYLEAMQYGKCCIAAKNCGSQDVVLDGQTGISVPVDDIDAVEAALLYLATNPARRLDMGERGQRHLTENFTFASFRNNQKNLLQRWSL